MCQVDEITKQLIIEGFRKIKKKKFYSSKYMDIIFYDSLDYFSKHHENVR